jgi:hypothetical protein
MNSMAMKKIALLLVVTVPALAGLGPVAYANTHRDAFPVSCDVLWPAVKDVVTKSGKYTVMSINEPEMTVSYLFGNAFLSKRVNSVVLNRQGDDACEMQTQTSFSGLAHNDAGDFKKRVEHSLAKEQQAADKVAKPFPEQASSEK